MKFWLSIIAQNSFDFDEGEVTEIVTSPRLYLEG